MLHPKILVQIDPDRQPSLFDAVVAIDSGIDQLLQYSGVTEREVVPLIHGAMFTRGPEALKNTAVFIGGSDSAAAEALLDKIQQTFFGPIRVSVMLDGNGCNTTAAAAVLAAARHVPLSGARALVLGGTGPVGNRVARLLLRQDALVTLASRDVSKATTACDSIRRINPEKFTETVLSPIGYHDAKSGEQPSFSEVVTQSQLIFSCGAAGICLLDEQALASATAAKLAIDLNAVAPAGLAGIAVTDKAAERGQRVDYGAIGVGGLKMKIHRAAIARLFASNDHILDAEQIFDIGLELEAGKAPGN